MKPDATRIASALARAGVNSAAVEDVPVLGVVARVTPAQTGAALMALKESDHDFAFLVDLFGIDTGEAVEAVYHLRSFARDEEVYVKVAYEYGGDLTSVWCIYPAALMPERELCEMFGLTLSGHPNPKYLLLTEGIDPLLLKRIPIRTPEEVRNR